MNHLAPYEEHKARKRTAIVRQGRGERLAARIAEVAWEPGKFVGIPDVRGKDWYIVKTNPQCEFRALQSLQRVGFHAYAPVFRPRVYDSRTKRRLTRTRPFIAGYVFVLLDRGDPDFGLVRECDGVKDVLPIFPEGELPVGEKRAKYRLPNSDIEKMRDAEGRYWLEQDLAHHYRHRNFTRKYKVVSTEAMILTKGGFAGFRAAIIKMEGKGLAKVIVPIVADGQNVQTMSVRLDDLETVS